MGDSSSDKLRFFVDRGIGSRIVPAALRGAGWVLETMDERWGKYGSQRKLDVDWIADAAGRGEISICKDTALASDYDEARTIYMNAARIFAFSNKHLTGDQMAVLLLERQDEIWTICHTCRRTLRLCHLEQRHPAVPLAIPLIRSCARLRRQKSAAHVAKKPFHRDISKYPSFRSRSRPVFRF